MGGCAENAYTPRGVLDGGEDVQACSGQRPGFEEVGGKNCVCLAAEEGGPGLAVALGCGIDAVVLEDLPYRGGGYLDLEGGEFAVDSSLSPARVFSDHAQDEGLDAAVGGWSSWPFAAGGVGVAAV